MTETVAALRANHLAADSDLYVFCDGPAGDRDRAATEAVRKAAREISGFRTVEVLEKERNAGLAASIIAGVSELLDEHGSAIVLEDDLVTSPFFLRYMNAALDRYRDAREVFSVSGYNQPPAVMRFPKGYAHDVYFTPRNSSQGWATWRDRWDKADWEAKGFERLARDPALRRAFNAGGDDLADMLIAEREGRINSWSIRWTFAHFTHNALAVYPVRSYVDNIGHDGSGTHTADPLLRNDVSRANPDVVFPAEIGLDAAVMRAFRRYYSRGRAAYVYRRLLRLAVTMQRGSRQSHS